MHKYDKSPRVLTKAKHLYWICDGVEYRLKLTKSHVVLYNVLFNDYHFYKRQGGKNPTFSTQYLAYESGLSLRGCKQALADLEKALLLSRRKLHKRDGTYKVTEFLGVIDVLKSSQHRLDLPPKPWVSDNYEVTYSYEQRRQYQENIKYSIKRGRYLSSEEKLRAYDRDLSTNGVSFSWETVV